MEEMEKEDDAGIEEWIRKELGGDWDDGVKMRGKFKAFSGQRCDWEPNFIFWRDLIIKLARHLHLFIIRPSQVKTVWFNRGGLTPLCLDDVLLEMHKGGDILRSGELVDPTIGWLSQIFRRVVRVAGLARSSTPLDIAEDHLILSTLLKEKVAEVVKVLSDNHWTSSCIITMRKLREICGGSEEAYAVLSHLSGCGKAKYLVINRKDVIEGVKVSLSPRAVSNSTSLDYDVLHLIWTVEKLQQQLDVIDQRCEMSRNLALASLKSGNKVIALRHTRKLKLASQSREKCSTFLNRVEEVVRVIADAESSKEVSEAMKIGARAIKENRMSVEEVQLCLQELDESIESQKEVNKALESTTSYADIEDEDIEDEFRKLELEVGGASSQVSMSTVGMEHSTGVTESSESADLLSNALSNLKLGDAAGKESVEKSSTKSMRSNMADGPRLEAA